MWSVGGRRGRRLARGAMGGEHDLAWGAASLLHAIVAHVVSGEGELKETQVALEE